MGTRVLIIDENKADREAVTKAFANYECDLVELEDGTKAMETIQREKPVLVLIEPQTTKDPEIFSKIKSDLTLRNTAVVVVTAVATREEVIAAARMGVRDFLLKPVKPSHLTDRIEQVVELKSKTRDIKDTVRILVVDDKALVIEQIKAACQETNWEISSAGRESEAMDMISSQLPDVILVSLSLPSDQAFSFFRHVHNNERTKRVPVFGLSVKTAVEEQTRAQQDGMTGIITKPIDANDLRQRLQRVLNVDTSQRYFAVRDNVLFVTFPPQTDTILSEIGANVKHRIADIVDNGMSKMLLDLSQVNAMDTNVIRLLIQVIEYSDELGIGYCIVGSSQIATKAKAFEETKNITIYEDVDQALKTLV